MRVDFSKKQFGSDVQQQYIRLVRVVRTFMGSVVIAGIGAIFVTAPPAHDGRWIDAMTWQTEGHSRSEARDQGQVSSSASGAQSNPTSSSATDPALSVIDGVVQHG